MSKEQKQITVPRKLFEKLEVLVPGSGYNSVSALSQYILNRWLEGQPQAAPVPPAEPDVPEAPHDF